MIDFALLKSRDNVLLPASHYVAFPPDATERLFRGLSIRCRAAGRGDAAPACTQPRVRRPDFQ